MVDCCGIKQDICRLGFELAQQHGFIFIGGHPMAGWSVSLRSLKANLFLRLHGADSGNGINLEAREQARHFSLGFSRITIAAPKSMIG